MQYKTFRHEEKCAYLHREYTSPQTKIVEAMTMLLLQHEQDIIHLVEEVKALKLSNEIRISEASIQGDKDIKAMEEKILSIKHLEKNEASEAEEMFQCEKCTYKCRNEITLNKHMNTKYVDSNIYIVTIQLATTIKSIKPTKGYKKMAQAMGYTKI